MSHFQNGPEGTWLGKKRTRVEGNAVRNVDCPAVESVCNLNLVCFALQVILHQEGHMDDGLTLQRCQREESQAARIIRNTTALFSQFVRYVRSFPFSVSTLRPPNPTSHLPLILCF